MRIMIEIDQPGGQSIIQADETQAEPAVDMGTPSAELLSDYANGHTNGKGDGTQVSATDEATEAGAPPMWLVQALTAQPAPAAEGATGGAYDAGAAPSSVA